MARMRGGKRVVVIEDSVAICRSLERALKETETTADWSLYAVTSPVLAVDVVRTEHPDLVLTDVHFRDPAMSGRRVIVSIRAIPSTVPIVAYSPREWSDVERATAVRCGASALVSMPLVARAELFAWFDVLTNQESGALPIGSISIGDLEVNVVQRIVRARGRRVDLTTSQWSLLATLVACAPLQASYDDLARACKYGEHYGRNALRVAIQRLRARISGTGVDIEPVPGFGYRLAILGAAGPSPVRWAQA